MVAVMSASETLRMSLFRDRLEPKIVTVVPPVTLIEAGFTDEMVATTRMLVQPSKHKLLDALGVYE
jgi:hypothetical protein